MASLVRTFLLIAASAISGPILAAAETKPSAIEFLGVEYFYRWSKGTQYEFTPAGQEDLEHFKDMLTINYYGQKSGDDLAATANAILENYKKHKAMVVKTDSVPRTSAKPAEHLIIVLFPRPEFIEAVFARLVIVKGVGLCVIYSHREYGKEAGEPMSAWLKKNGQSIEKSLMKLSPIPLADELKK